MMNIRRAILTLLLAIAAIPALLPTAARAETYQACAGFIDSLPATITTQGVWCLDKNLGTAITSGNAITIDTNNVTIDCNNFKVGGLAAGDDSDADGIYAVNRQNVTVRHCNVRGFRVGINLYGGAGHLVEDNRLDNNLVYGIYVTGENSLVQRNRVFDTGGRPNTNLSYGIDSSADLLDNTVAGVFAAGAGNTYPSGIRSTGTGAEIRGNRVRGLAPTGIGTAFGIYVSGAGSKAAENQISAEAATTGTGIFGNGPNTFCTGNTVTNFATDYDSCEINADNYSLP